MCTFATATHRLVPRDTLSRYSLGPVPLGLGHTGLASRAYVPAGRRASAMMVSRSLPIQRLRIEVTPSSRRT